VAGTLPRWKRNIGEGLETSAGFDGNGRLTFTLIYETGLDGNPNRWRFILRSSDGHDGLVAEDVEPGVCGERLELLTVLRALESLNQSSRIIVWTRSPSLREGLLYGLKEWPFHDWCWERFGQRVPVRNRDLWQRIERVTRFHEIECRTWRFDPPHVHNINPPNSRGFLNSLFSGRPSRRQRSNDARAVGQRENSWGWLFGAFRVRRSTTGKTSP
jgi:ribonuclease HI